MALDTPEYKAAAEGILSEMDTEARKFYRRAVFQEVGTHLSHFIKAIVTDNPYEKTPLFAMEQIFKAQRENKELYLNLYHRPDNQTQRETLMQNELIKLREIVSAVNHPLFKK